jgi:hypothetical protein
VGGVSWFELVGGWGFSLGLIRTLVGNGFGVSCHFSLPGLQALVPGWDEDVYVLGALQSLEGDEDDFYFGCLFSCVSWCVFSGR